MSVRQVHIERSCYQSTTALDHLKPSSKKSSKDIYIDLLDRALQALQEGKDNQEDPEAVPLHNVDLALEKVVALHYNYHLNTKLVAGANNLLGAISNSPAGRVRTILNELSHEKHEARFKLNGLESEFKEFLGYLHIEPKSLIGHGRLCGGDVYEVSIKCGTQKIKTHCKIDSSLDQRWKDSQKSLKITYHDQITVKVIDKRKYERNINVGEVTFSLMNLLSVRPLNIVVALGTCTSLRLNFTLAWTPVVGGQQINFDPFGKLVYQETVIGGLCQGLGGALKNRATSLAQLQQLSLADSNCKGPDRELGQSMISIVELAELPSLSSLLQDTVILYEDYELKFSEVKALLNSLRDLREELQPQPHIGSTMSSASSASASNERAPRYFGSTAAPLPYFGSSTHLASDFTERNPDLSASSFQLNGPDQTRWISESMRPRARKKSIFSSVRQKKYKRYNVPIAPMFNNYDQTLKKTRLTSKSEQVDRFLAVHLQYLQDIVPNLQCSYLLKNRQAKTLSAVKQHTALFNRVTAFINSPSDHIASVLEPNLADERWSGLWEMLCEGHRCTVTYQKLYEQLCSHYGHIVESCQSSEEVFRFMIESMTDSGKYKDNSVATVCQVIQFFKERAPSGVARFLRTFCNEFTIVAGLEAPLLRVRQDAVERYHNLPFNETKFRIAMCMLGSTRAEALSLTSAVFTEVLNSVSMQPIAQRECCKGLEDISPYIRYCASLAIDKLDVQESIQLLQRIAATDQERVQGAAMVALNRWGFKEDPFKEGVHPYLTIRHALHWSAEEVLHFTLSIPNHLSSTL